MKYLIIFLFSFQVYAQNLLLFDDDSFNPLTFDTHTIALFDGDIGLTTLAWGDQANAYDISWVNAPDTTKTVNGHKAVLLNGTDEDGSTASMSLIQPCTYYLVVKQVTWTNLDYIIGGTAGSAVVSVQQSTTTPRIALSGKATITNDEFTVGAYKILTVVGNGANSILQINQTTASTGDIGTGNPGGIIIGDRPSGSRNSNIEVAYVIIRNQADDLATRTKFQQFLADRFGITL